MHFKVIVHVNSGYTGWLHCANTGLKYLRQCREIPSKSDADLNETHNSINSRANKIAWLLVSLCPAPLCHNNLRFPPAQKYPQGSFLPHWWLHAGQGIHVQWPIRTWLGTWQTNVSACAAASPPGLTCKRMGVSSIQTYVAFTASAAHMCSTCSSILEQYFGSPAHGKGQRISSTMKHYPEGINYSCKC